MPSVVGDYRCQAVVMRRKRNGAPEKLRRLGDVEHGFLEAESLDGTDAALYPARTVYEYDEELERELTILAGVGTRELLDEAWARATPII